MKYSNLKAFVLTTLFSTLNIISLYAKKRPPAPFGNDTGFSDVNAVGTPIDSAIPLLFFGALLFGIWATKKYKSQIS